jgi:hypothetical protein
MRAVVGLVLLLVGASAAAAAPAPGLPKGVPPGLAGVPHPVWHRPPPPPTIRDVKACGDSRAFFAFITTFYKDVHGALAGHRIGGAQARTLNVQVRGMALAVESHPAPRAQMDVCGRLDKMRPR